ncbi:MAG: hypothetical protein AB7K09_20775 [Planctomycetota bacterium]
MGRPKHKRDKPKKHKKQKLVAVVSSRQKEKAEEALSKHRTNRRIFISIVIVSLLIMAGAWATSGAWMKKPPKNHDGRAGENQPADNAPADNTTGTPATTNTGD